MSDANYYVPCISRENSLRLRLKHCTAVSRLGSATSFVTLVELISIVTREFLSFNSATFLVKHKTH